MKEIFIGVYTHHRDIFGWFYKQETEGVVTGPRLLE